MQVTQGLNLTVRRNPHGALRPGAHTTPTAPLVRGFTLIEIMAVVLIMGPAGGNRRHLRWSARSTRPGAETARAQIKQIESRRSTFYQMDNGRFPTSEQGLQALVAQPSSGPEARNYRAGGYLSKKVVPPDAWGGSFGYQAPGSNNPESFDLWSYGADGQPGGEGTDGDIGNWEGPAG